MIRLQFAAEANIASHLIEYYGHGSYAHVDTVMPGGELIGARISGGVAVRQPGYAPFIRTLLVEIPATEDQTNKYLDGVLSEVGRPYDLWAIAAFAAGRNWRAGNSWFCSELVAAKLEDAGVFKYPLVTPINRVTPPDLMLALSVLIPIQIPAAQAA